MKIDENCINHNVIVLLKDITNSAEEVVFISGKDEENYAKLAYFCGFARGTLGMADAKGSAESMKRWELFNKVSSNRKQSLLTQALEMFVDKMTHHIEIGHEDEFEDELLMDSIHDFFEKVDCDGLFKEICEWLEREVDE